MIWIPGSTGPKDSQMREQELRAPVVLIVDGSAPDRANAADILSLSMPCEIQQAIDGEEACGMVRARVPDLVLTALRMPRMNGLELVTQLHRDCPLVPTVIMTNSGSEQTAVEALQAGAASYVPKRTLSDSLSRVVRQVLSVSQQTHRLRHVLASKESHSESFVLENNPGLIAPLANHLESQVTSMWDETGHHSIQLAVALQEALTNSLFHGNLGLSSELRQDGSGAFWKLAEQIRHLSPWRDRRLHVQAIVRQDSARFVIRDEGDGFDPSKVASPLGVDQLELCSGRGIFLMRQFLDEVSYSHGGREVSMLLLRRALIERAVG